MSKYRLLRQRLVLRGVVNEAQLLVPKAAGRSELERVHSPDYVNRVFEGSLGKDEVRRIGFPWSREMVERSLRSVGATLEASRAALEEGVSVNLAGGTHHASRDCGQGYCVFNDAAVAIRDAQFRKSIRRAVVIDCDVHHGNGTALVFGQDPSVFTLSIHSANAFPIRKPASDCDLPLEDGADDSEYLGVLMDALPDVLDRSRPDLAVYLAGADPYRRDSLGKMSLTKAGLRSRDKLVIGMCRDARIPTVVCMAGGYAKNVSDIVDIHEATVRVALDFWTREQR